MALSIQTNVNSLIAQENLRANNDFQSKTIGRLTSGFRINASGDDAAGLAVANKFRSDTTELTQGVRNANDGISQLQIIDGGLANISKILDRMKTLATQSSSDTFTGSRDILNTEYQALMSEVTRQANNAGLGSGTLGGRFNTNISVYIGGGSDQSNSQVSIDLSGSSNKVDAAGLSLSATKINGSAGITVGNVDIRSGSTYYSSNATQDFTFDLTGGRAVTAKVTGTGSGITGQAVVDQLNSQLNNSGITASMNSTTGLLEFSGSSGFLASTTAVAGGAATAAVTPASFGGANKAMQNKTFTIGAAAVDGAQTLTFKVGSNTVGTVSVANSDTAAAIGVKMRNALAGSGIDFVANGTSGALFSGSAFTVESDAAAGKQVITAVDGTAGVINEDSTTEIASKTPTVSGNSVGNAKASVTALTAAVGYLGSVQGKVGTAQNKLAYAINLAQSQISNFSAAESRIRDTDVAAEAANLTKASVLSQASMAAMAQANSAPQAVLALLRG